MQSVQKRTQARKAETLGALICKSGVFCFGGAADVSGQTKRHREN